MRGTLLGNYRVLDKLGEGGMGEVFIGRHEALGHSVAVKILRSELSSSADMVKRFFNEAQAATSIRNPGIVQIFDFGTTPEGSAYFVMELLEGESLAARVKQRRLGYAECCRIGRQVANVLHVAHARGITHRDLKPDNLFLVVDPEVMGGERVKVLDFGIAKLAGEVQAAGVKTRTGLIMGTPTYMSPEQCRGAGTVDPRADIYSLGCILFEMVSGRPPFVGEGAGEIVGAHLHVPPPLLQNLAPDVPPGLAALIAHMLAKQPEARPQAMAAVGQALDEILRAIEGAPARSSIPPPMRAPTPMPMPMPQLSTSSTTLGGSAGVTAVDRRGRRNPFVVGGIVLAGALAVIVLVAAIRDSDSQPTRSPSDDTGPRSADAELAAASPDATIALPPADAAELAATAPAPTEPPDAAQTAVVPSGTPSEIEVECLRYQTNEKWGDLDSCADRLKSVNPALAKELKNRAVAEARSAPRIVGVETALRDKNLKKAKAELDQIWQSSTSFQRIKAKYDTAESAAIAEAVARLDRVNSGDCKEYNAILAQERASKPPRVAAEAARQVRCTSATRQPACDADALAEKGRDAYGAGSLTVALAAYDAAIACRPDPLTIQKAVIVACNLHNIPKAKLYWKRTSPTMRPALLNICIRNGISEDELNAP